MNGPRRWMIVLLWILVTLITMACSLDMDRSGFPTATASTPEPHSQSLEQAWTPAPTPTSAPVQHYSGDGSRVE